VREFIELVAAHPPFTARARGIVGGGAVAAAPRRVKKTA
jgi:hypothetical protein